MSGGDEGEIAPHDWRYSDNQGERRMTIQILKSAQAYLLALALALGQFAVTEDALADDKKWFDSCAANITGVSALGGVP